MISRPRMLASVAVGAVIGLALGRATLAPGGEQAYEMRAQEIMATTIAVEAPASQIDRAAAIVFGVFRDVDSRMSEWKDTSPLAAVNHAAGVAPAPVPPDLRALLHRAIDIGDMTGGAFDVTWAALWGLWDFNAEAPRPPTDDAIAPRLELIDYRLVRIDDHEGTVFLPRPGMLLGLGGIAKGYALDRAAEALRREGIRSFLLSAGGQVLVGEPRAGLRPWRIGVRDPRGDTDDYFTRLEITNASISTSGDYERYFIADGVRYHHVLDPRTGRPARGLRSVAVVSRDATLADALSTALMVIGPEKGLALVRKTPGVEALMVDEQGRVHASPGLRRSMRQIHPPRPDREAPS